MLEVLKLMLSVTAATLVQPDSTTACTDGSPHGFNPIRQYENTKLGIWGES